MNCRTLALIVVACGAVATSGGGARAAECPGNPNALGTSRIMTIDPHDFPRIGTVQYSRSLPLEDKEVVLSFDDGPIPPYTNRILEVLAEQCVKANYFIIGRMARGYPDLLRSIHAAGHVIGTHSQNHPLAFERMPLDVVQREVEDGIASVSAALGNRNAVAPFFRIPGLLRAPQVEGYLQTRGLTTWSADVVADDWKHITGAEIVRRAMARLDEKGKGIVLLHDIQPATALALPELLRELKARGYRVVQVVPGKHGAPSPATIAATPAVPAADALARAVASPDPPKPDVAPDHPIPREPARPFTPGLKPALSVATSRKLAATEPGGWPPAVSVPVPAAGGVGVSPLARTSEAPDGRFQQTR